jgi:elongation factor P hydroxylase
VNVSIIKFFRNAMPNAGRNAYKLAAVRHNWYKAILLVGCYAVMHYYSQLIELFNKDFKGRLATELVRGGCEPVYIPRSEDYPYDRVIFAHGYFSSALHEISHWSIAGAERRKLLDFGYWYNLDGRTEQQQKEFELVEIKPQALEWIFCQAANFQFNVSLDNLSGDISAAAEAAETFKDKIWQQTQTYIKNGLPQRANIFVESLAANYRGNEPLSSNEFKREDL